MKKVYNILLCLIAFFGAVPDISSAETKLIEVSIGNRQATDKEIAESVVIERGADKIRPYKGIDLKEGDVISVNKSRYQTEGHITAILNNGSRLELYKDGSKIKINNGYPDLSKGERFFTRKGSESRGVKKTEPEELKVSGTKDKKEQVKIYTETTQYYVAIQGAEKPRIAVFEGEIKVTDKFGIHTLTPKEIISNMYKNFLSERVYIDRMESYGGGNILKDYGYLKPIIGNHFGYSRVPIRSSFPSRGVVSGGVAVDSPKELKNLNFYVIKSYEYENREIRQWINSVRKAVPKVFDRVPPLPEEKTLPDNFADNIFQIQENKAKKPPSDSGGVIPTLSGPVLKKLSIASIITGEAGYAKRQSVIIKSAKGQIKPAFNGMKLKNGDRIITRNAFVILEADNGLFFYLFRDTSLHLKQGKLCIVKGDAYYSDLVTAKINEADRQH